jgi:hypothetical protein
MLNGFVEPLFGEVNQSDGVLDFRIVGAEFFGFEQFFQSAGGIVCIDIRDAELKIALCFLARFGVKTGILFGARYKYNANCKKQYNNIVPFHGLVPSVIINIW